MRIFHITPFYPPHVGGLQSHAKGFDQHLARAGLEITTLAPRIPKTAPTLEQHPNLTIYRYPAVELIPNYPLPALWNPAFWKQLREANPRGHTIIISRTRFFLTALGAVGLAKVLGKPYVHIEHGSDHVSLKHPLLRALAWLYDYTLGRLPLLLARTIVANSKASAAFVKKLSGRDATVIYRGVDKEVIEQTAPTNRNKNIATIAFVGRLIDGKGVDDLIRAVKRLSIPHELLIIGTGPQEDSLKKLVSELKLESSVIFAGEKNFTATIALLKTADVFVNPSHTEGLPTSVIEAALCKVAIIATNVGGTPEIVTEEKSAILIPPKDHNLLTQKVQELLHDETLRKRLRENAYQEVSQKFSWDETVKQYECLFDSLVD